MSAVFWNTGVKKNRFKITTDDQLRCRIISQEKYVFAR